MSSINRITIRLSINTNVQFVSCEHYHLSSPSMIVILNGSIKSRSIGSESGLLLEHGWQSWEMNSVDDWTRGISLTNKRIHECSILITIISLSQTIFSDKLATYIIIDSIFYVAFENFIRGCRGGVIVATGSRVWVCWPKDESSTSSGGPTSSSIETIYFMRGTAVFLNVLVFAILISEAPQKCFARHTTSNIWNTVFTFLGSLK